MCRESTLVSWRQGGTWWSPVPHFLLLLLFKFCAQCLHERSTGFEDSLGLVPYFCSMLPAGVLPPWWKCQFFLLWWGTWSKPWIVWCRLWPWAKPFLCQSHLHIWWDSSLLLACFPIPCSCQTPPPKKKKKVWDRAGLWWAPSEVVTQWCVWAEMSPWGSDCNTEHYNNFFLDFR